jgi:hypothetical protein
MSEKPIFYQLFNKLTPLPARPSDLKLAHWKPGINLLSEGQGQGAHPSGIGIGIGIGGRSAGHRPSPMAHGH